MQELENQRDDLLDGDRSDSGTGSSPKNTGSRVTKAADASNFVPWEEQVFPSNPNLAVANKVIVKKINVRPGTPQTIVPDVPSTINRRSMNVMPVIEDDTIVGMKITCSCGNSHEVRFEFDV